MIDFHCHIDLFRNPEEIIREAQRRNIYVLAVTTTPKSWAVLKTLLDGCDRIRPALGLHPELARERENETLLFRELLPDTDYVGEIGLDGSPAHEETMPVQMRVFQTILESCASSGGKVLSIHSRGAATEVLDHLERVPAAGKPVFHWFSGSLKELERAIALGAWFSVGPAMLRSQKGRELASRMPMSRVLTETDGPFTQTQGHPTLPWHVKTAEVILGSIWNISQAEVTTVLKRNLRVLLSERHKRSRDS